MAFKMLPNASISYGVGLALALWAVAAPQALDKEAGTKPHSALSKIRRSTKAVLSNYALLTIQTNQREGAEMQN